MFWKIMMIILLLVLVLWAVRSRVFLKRRRGLENMEATVASPASIAVGELVAVAGGIYLSLVLASSFLKLSVPDKVTLLSMTIDPLALAALTIALFQPIFFWMYYRLFKRY